MPAYTDQLRAEIEGRYPVPRESKVRDQIIVHRAFRESNKDLLRPAGWSKGMTENDGVRDYIVDPLGERIPQVWSDMLFGEEPSFIPVESGDANRMAEMVNANDLTSELQRAEEICSSEGEVWWRVMQDDTLGHARVEWHSRMVVVPLWVGTKAVAVAYVSELERTDKVVWRYVEIHEAGWVTRLLYEGRVNVDKIGEARGLDARPETQDWEAEWNHGFDMLAGRVVNRLGTDPKFGISDYAGLEDLLLALNETTTIGQENARLTAKQRAILPQRFLDTQGNFPRGAEILVATEVDQDPEKVKNQVAMVEFEFDANALIAYIEHITDRILTRARVAPQLVGRHTEGAQTGPALRARVLDSILAAQGKGKPWDDQVPHQLRLMIQIERDIMGIPWAKTNEDPTFRRTEALPEDAESKARRLAIEINAEMLSRKTAIAMAHPEWDAQRVQAEVDQIMKELGNDAPAPDNPVPPVGPGNQPIIEKTPATGEKEERRDGPNGKR